MDNLLKLVLGPYFMLGMAVGVSFSKHSSWHPGVKGWLIIGAIHLVLIGAAAFMVINPRQSGTKLSQSGLAFGFAFAYVAGFIIFLFV